MADISLFMCSTKGVGNSKITCEHQKNFIAANLLEGETKNVYVRTN